MSLLALVISKAPDAQAISAPIHISGTGGEGVFIRSGPSTGYQAVGWMPEGASPDYNCFVWGQNINGVPIWFNVNYNGVTGFYASYYDDSSYHSNEELTAKYGIPLCGSAPPSPSPPPPAGPPPSAGPSSASVYFSPYSKGSHEVADGATLNINRPDWESGCDTSHPNPSRPYHAAVAASGGRPITTVAGWSSGRLGVGSYLDYATTDQLRQASYALLIDPGFYDQLTCDRQRHAGAVFAKWLQLNSGAHMVVISGNLSQRESSKGIQESYFNAIRRAGSSVTARVLICNYTIEHEDAFWSAKYWIQHQIGSTRNACPWLLVNGQWKKPTAGWHP